MPNDEVYVPMKGWMKPSCANCVEDHIDCAIKAILRDHLIEYYQDRSGQLDSKDWEREKIDFAQWHCSRWQLDTPENNMQRLERKVGREELAAILQEKAKRPMTPEDYRIARIMEPWPPSEKITPEEQAKDLPLSLLSAAELNDLQKPKGPWTPQTKDTLLCPVCGNDYWQHGPRGGLAENIRCTRCGRIYNTELTGLVLVGRDTVNLPDAPEKPKED